MITKNCFRRKNTNHHIKLICTKIKNFQKIQQNLIRFKKNLSECKTWFDVVVLNYYEKLASVTFVIDRQEEIIE